MTAIAEISADPRIALVDRWQRDFPLVPRPYAEIGRESELSEHEVISALGECIEDGVLSRIGVTVKPNTAGASTLAAVAAPEGRIEEIAAIVNAEPGVNHNYEREHELNLWFVATAPDREALAGMLARIAGNTGLDVVDLPLERAYHIDLGFRLDGRGDCRRGAGSTPASREPCPDDKRLLAEIEDGLPLSPRPYAEIALRLGWREEAVLSHLDALLNAGVVTRLGCIVRHRALGFDANAMVAWDVPDEAVDNAGLLVGCHEIVTLCYRRTRRPPAWPYNLFAMIHGRERAAVERAIENVSIASGLEGLPRAVLFSKRCFRQRGARYSSDEARQRAGAA